MLPAPRRTLAPMATPRSIRGLELLAHDRALGPLVAGADEAGRGALAGPIVGAAVLFDHRLLDPDLQEQLAGLDDSKRLRAAEREVLAERIQRIARAVVVVAVGAAVIDARGIQAANIHALGAPLTLCAPDPCLRLVDGFALGPSWPAHRRMVRGDRTSAAIAAASIIAKTERDRLMSRAAETHPGYGFERHMGYPTPAHRAAITEAGPSRLHRLSFCRRLLEERASGVSQADS